MQSHNRKQDNQGIELLSLRQPQAHDVLLVSDTKKSRQGFFSKANNNTLILTQNGWTLSRERDDDNANTVTLTLENNKNHQCQKFKIIPLNLQEDQKSLSSHASDFFNYLVNRSKPQGSFKRKLDRSSALQRYGKLLIANNIYIELSRGTMDANKFANYHEQAKDLEKQVVAGKEFASGQLGELILTVNLEKFPDSPLAMSYKQALEANNRQSAAMLVI